MTEGRPPPYSEEAERAVIGSFLLDGDRSATACHEFMLAPEDFYNNAMATCFLHVQKLIVEGSAIDEITLGKSLKNSDHLERIGGAHTLQEVIDGTVTVTNVSHYAEIVKSESRKRQLLAKAREIEESVFAPDANTEEIIKSTHESLFSIGSHDLTVQSNADALNELFEEYTNTTKGIQNGLPCFMPKLAGEIGNFRFGKPYYIGAAPAAGKSTLAGNQTSFWSWDNNIPGAIASIEMEHGEWLARNICERADVSEFALRHNHCEDHGEEKGSRLKKAYAKGAEFIEKKVPLYINDKIHDMEELEMWASMMVSNHGIKFLVIDFIQLLTSKRCKGGNKEQLEYCALRIMRLAKRLGIVILVCSQLSGDGGKGEVPKPSDLFGSKTMQHLAYAILMIYESEGSWYIDPQKHRGGPGGKVECNFNKPRQRFERKDSFSEFDDDSTQ